jgi:hypothetical protein
MTLLLATATQPKEHYLGGGVPYTPHIAKRVVYSKPPSLLRVVHCKRPSAEGGLL